MNVFYFKTTEVETITREVIYSSYGDNEQEAKESMINEMKNGYYYKNDFPRTIQPIKSVSSGTGLKALEKECISVKKEDFMSDEELKKLSSDGLITNRIVNFENTHPELYEKFRVEFDERCGDYDAGESIVSKYYELAFGEKIFYCPVSDGRYPIEEGVIAEYEYEPRLLHKTAVHKCERCGRTLIEIEASECEDCSW